VERAYHELRASAAAAAAEGAEASRALAQLRESHAALSKEADANRDRLEREVSVDHNNFVSKGRESFHCFVASLSCTVVLFSMRASR
jgi:hypothetical protein